MRFASREIPVLLTWVLSRIIIHVFPGTALRRLHKKISFRGAGIQGLPSQNAVTSAISPARSYVVIPLPESTWTEFCPEVCLGVSDGCE